MGIKRTVKRKSVAKPKTTIGEAYTSFVTEKQAKGLVESTLANYEQSLKYFKKHFNFDDDTEITVITRELVIQWINAMRESDLSAAALNHYLRDCRAFFYWCMHDDRKFIAPFKIEQVRAQETKQKTYSKEDLKRLLAKPKNENDFVEWRTWAIANVAYDMGGRCAEITNIQMQDVNLTKRTIYLRHTKNKALSHMPISSQCAKVLKEYMAEFRSDAADEDYLFCNYGNEQLSYNALAHSYTRYCKNREIEKHSLHGIRHTFATALAENTNGDMVKVQKALRHSSIDMARKYIDLANVSMGNYDDISPLAQTKDKRGRPKRKVN